jgi:excisionase family DNA binding protein
MTIESNKRMPTDTNPATPELISVEAAAARLSLSPWTLRRWVCDRKIASVKLGTRRLIPVSEIARLISDGMANRDEPAASAL